MKQDLNTIKILWTVPSWKTESGIRKLEKFYVLVDEGLTVVFLIKNKEYLYLYFVSWNITHVTVSGSQNTGQEDTNYFNHKKSI